MRTARALIGTELMKLRHTSTLWLSALFPVFLLLLAAVVLLDEYAHWRPRPPRPHEWEMATRQWWMLWTGVVTPVFIAVECAGLAAAEHAGKHWKQLYVQPVPRWSFYAAKVAVCALLVAVSFLIFSTGLCGLATFRMWLLDLRTTLPVPWGLMWWIALRALASCGAAIAIQMWLSIRFAGFGVPVGIGMAATASGIVAAQLHLTGWWPWMMPIASLPWRPNDAAGHPIFALVLFAAVTVFAGWRLSRAEIV
jgi:lantibiotic transport system permease protein